VLLIFEHSILGSLQVHGPATFPVMFLTGVAVEDVACVAMFQAANLVTLKRDRVKDFGRLASVLDLFLFPHWE